MKRCLIMVALLSLLGGCAAPEPAEPIDNALCLYEPDRRYELVYRTGFGDRTGGVDFRQELLLETAADETPGGIGFTMTFKAEGYSSRDWNDDPRGWLFKSPNLSDAERQMEVGYYRECVAELADAVFRGRIESNGSIGDFDATGTLFETLKRKWADASDEEISQANPFQDTQQYFQHLLRASTMGAFSALADSLAYLPPDEELQVGRRWLVVREATYPYCGWVFALATEGAYCSTERSTCNVKSITPTADGRIARISIVGARSPQYPAEETSARLSRIDVSGRLEMNLDTREVIELWIKSKPRFVREEDKGFDIAFIDSLQVRQQDGGE